MYQIQVAENLLQINAVSISLETPFTWTSGIKSPIYCDNRLILGFPSIRKQIVTHFCALIAAHYPQVEVIAGTSTAGIPHAAWIADQLDLPMIYVRDKSKEHGKKNQIEGGFSRNKKVVVIEDLISTGKSVVNVVNAIREAGGNVMGVAAIFSYQLESAKQAMHANNIDVAVLTDYHTLLRAAREENMITHQDEAGLKHWNSAPHLWANTSIREGSKCK